jgi:cell division protease FtsH
MYLGGGGPEFQSRAYAEATQRIVDAEVSRLLREAEQKAIELLTHRREELDRLTKLLLESETVDGEAVYRLVGRPPPRRPYDEEISPGLRDQAASSPTDQQT